MAPRALTIEEKRKRIRERTRKRRIQQRQHRQAQYEEECSHYSTVRRSRSSSQWPKRLVRAFAISSSPLTGYTVNLIGSAGTSVVNTSRMSSTQSFAHPKSSHDAVTSGPSSSQSSRGTYPSSVFSSNPSLDMPGRAGVISAFPCHRLPCRPGSLSTNALRSQPGAIPPRVPPNGSDHAIPGHSNFVHLCSVVYDQMFRSFFNPTCDCPHSTNANETEDTQTLREVAQHLQSFLPPPSTVFGESESYDASGSFGQWRRFLSDQPSRPLSFQKSQASPLSNTSINIAPVIQPHGLQLAQTRHILLRTFNTKCVRFAAFLFFPNATASKTPTIKNALSSERQKDLYNLIIIPAAHEAISGPPLQEIPQTYEIAYAKFRSF
ncbi:hypothetical protein EDB81DRAFT_756424 [Dactylonectria macrodidyma]|uniref:Uncharacterized protein n=1 Tax=Dactylonectria macrodidyma TaxID=307937 RepID=A0A9P9F5L8_9HYPO|nr:hypothetical protein EDB81DRAFT_756424 [Dactylonectria macrodidyma]